jgi:hypothetical protein
LLSAVRDADWLRLMHYLEARFPEVKAKKKRVKVTVKEGLKK